MLHNVAGNLMQHLKHPQRGRVVSKWLKGLLFINIAHYGSFQLWLYLALPLSAMIYLTIDCHRLPLTGLNASVYTGLNVQAISDMIRP